MSAKTQASATKPTRRDSLAKASLAPSVEAAEPDPADNPARHSEPNIREVGGSGLALWDNALLLRTMRTLRPPTLRDGETAAQHKMEIVGLAGTALAAFKPKDAVEAMIASQAMALHFASLECARCAMLTYMTTLHGGGRVASDYTIALASTPQPFGDRRWWVLCPVTGSRAAILYLPTGRTRFASQAALRSSYRTQRISPRDRTMELAQDIRIGMGASGNLFDGFPPKPLRMQ